MSSKWYDHHPQFCDSSFTVFCSKLTTNVDAQAKHFSQMFPKANIISTTFKLFNTWIKCHRCVQRDLNASRAIIKFLAFRRALIFSQRNRETHIHTTSRKKIIKSPLTVKKSINFTNLTWKVHTQYSNTLTPPLLRTSHLFLLTYVTLNLKWSTSNIRSLYFRDKYSIRDITLLVWSTSEKVFAALLMQS